MKHEDFIKKLEDISFKETVLESHKRRLKVALMPAPRKQHYFINPWLKRGLAVSMVVILVFFLSFNQTIQPSQIVFAEQIIDQALEDISKLKIQDEGSREKIRFLTSILEEAKNSKEVKYLGEENGENNTTIKKLSFTDEDLSQDVILKINLNNPLLNSVDFQFVDELHMPFDVISGEVQNGRIIDKKSLSAQLLDPSIKKEWIKTLIQHRNQECLQQLKNSFSQQQTFTQTKDQEMLSEEMTPFINSAEMLILNCHESWSYDQNGNLNKFHLSVYSFGNQKEKMLEAKGIIQKAIEKLSLVTSIEAKEKIQLLEKAKKSKELRYSPWREGGKNLTFVDKELAGSTVDIRIDPMNAGVEGVQFRFTPDLNIEESRNIVRIITADLKKDLAEIKALFSDEDLRNNPAREMILKYIVRPQNEEMFRQSLSLEGIDQNTLKELKPIIESSEVLILERPYYSKNTRENVQTFALKTFSFGAQKKYQKNPEAWAIDPNQLIDGFIQKFSKLGTDEAERKISILKTLKRAQFQGYDGDFMFPHPDGTFEPNQRGTYGYADPKSLLQKRYQRYRFTLNLDGENIFVAILHDPDSNDENSIDIESLTHKF